MLTQRPLTFLKSQNPVVVSITTESKCADPGRRSVPWREEFLRRFFGAPSMPREQRQRGLGSAARRLRHNGRMSPPEVGGVSPLFIVKNVPAALAFYRDRLGFDVTFQGPEPNDIFFGIVQRGKAMIMFKDVGVEPVPNGTRDIGQGIARWDAYVYVPDPDALAAEFSSRHVEFFQPIGDNDDRLRGFEVRDADGYILFFGRPIDE